MIAISELSRGVSNFNRGTMAKFLKNLKGLFIATDEELIEAERQRTGGDSSSSTPTTSSSSSAPAQSSESIVQIDRSDIVAGAEGKVDQKFMDILLESVTKNNQEGYDYLEYKQALQSLKKMDMDESTRFQSAFAMAQTMGASKQKLVETGEAYLQVLKSEEEKFMVSVANQRQSKIDQRRQELLNIDKWVAEKQAEIQKIKEQIAKKKANKTKFEKELASTATKIETVKNNFEASYKFLSAQIVDDINKIKQYLK